MPKQPIDFCGELELIPVRVRFYPPVAAFILEGERRHPNQQIGKPVKDKLTGEILQVDYTVPLPRRSFDEFLLWVHRYIDAAIIISPLELAEKHVSAAQRLIDKYRID
ncbi:WYL domain-containing protein [Brunnivagina elsteri]|uniref:WYL domain-containing protein n=1 Tax=Brunnivagina elsteri TaxID=1247191 RepID=UPI001FE5CF62|nr:WYL domain-containing protein [Calothrix elsteri]